MIAYYTDCRTGLWNNRPKGLSHSGQEVLEKTPLREKEHLTAAPRTAPRTQHELSKCLVNELMDRDIT